LSDVAGVSFALVAELAAADDGETSSVKERKRALAKEAGGSKSEVMPKPFRVVIVFGAEKVDAFPSPCVHAFSERLATRKRKQVSESGCESKFERRQNLLLCQKIERKAVLGK